MKEDIFHLGIKALIRNNEGKILLLKVNKAVLKGYNGTEYWDIPGGRIHKNSTPEETLRREVEEETGITHTENINSVSMVLSNIRIPLDNAESAGLILSVYSCSMGETESIRLSEEHTEYAWFEPVEASRLLEFKYPKEFTGIIANLK